jgi:hypothetical protein
MWTMLMSMVSAAEGRPEPSWAGIITACAAVFTALALVVTAVTGLIRSLRVEGKVEGVGHQVTDVQGTLSDNREAGAAYVASLLASLDALRAEVVELREAASRTPPAAGHGKGA